MAEKPLLWIGNPTLSCERSPMTPAVASDLNYIRFSRGYRLRTGNRMPLVGSGVAEIRIHTAVEHRVLYVASFEEAVYVLHAFEKRSQKTPRLSLALARARFGALLAERRANAPERKGS